MGYYANQMAVELLRKIADKMKEKKAAKCSRGKEKTNSRATDGAAGKESQSGCK